jgi:hypothetical protein
VRRRRARDGAVVVLVLTAGVLGSVLKAIR